MNKTSYKQQHVFKKEGLTQGNFYKRPTHSPIRSQKSFDEASIKTELLINKQYRILALIQPSPPPIGASSISDPPVSSASVRTIRGRSPVSLRS
jgi:hypothetical protein